MKKNLNISLLITQNQKIHEKVSGKTLFLFLKIQKSKKLLMNMHFMLMKKLLKLKVMKKYAQKKGQININLLILLYME